MCCWHLSSFEGSSFEGFFGKYTDHTKAPVLKENITIDYMWYTAYYFLRYIQITSPILALCCLFPFVG
ncbi:hypothetical protein L873DRAFT_1805599 [Choiromyces venosus 120613-1]|uniref:Uncharacterized protein n=1 Tax=Choiromyces venosus 120613-1 TaxID=1336337 RepID=A0A3N4JPF8_9PEZI|nr:hypothetical protein L873DRAFT_1805599 [Choiromyces venosus 120613-1]